VDEIIILEGTLKKCNVKEWAGFIRLTIGTSGGYIAFHKMRDIS
jgi:hypothetical protein